MTKYIQPQKGFIKLIILIVLGLILLGYFGFNIREIIEGETVQSNLGYFWDLIVRLWVDYLRGPAVWIWDNIISILWDLFRDGLDKLQNDEFRP